MSVWARELLREVLPRRVTLSIDVVDHDSASSELESRFKGVRQSTQGVGPGDEAIDDDRDVVLVGLLERGRFGEANLLAVNQSASVTGAGQLGEQVNELALFLTHHRGHHEIAGTLVELHQVVGNLLNRLRLDGSITLGTVRNPDARPEQAHVVVNLGDGSHG